MMGGLTEDSIYFCLKRTLFEVASSIRKTLLVISNNRKHVSKNDIIALICRLIDEKLLKYSRK